MRHLVTASLVLAGVIHLLPLGGALGAGQLARLYGTRLDDPDLQLLLRHRAVLFGLLGAFMILAVFQGSLRGVALTAAIVSTASFVVLARVIGGHGEAIARVVRIDVVLLVVLAAGALAHVVTTPTG